MLEAYHSLMKSSQLAKLGAAFFIPSVVSVAKTSAQRLETFSESEILALLIFSLYFLSSLSFCPSLASTCAGAGAGVSLSPPSSWWFSALSVFTARRRITDDGDDDDDDDDDDSRLCLLLCPLNCRTPHAQHLRESPTRELYRYRHR